MIYTDFQERIKKILAGEFEFTDEEKEQIRRYWLSDEELLEEQSATYYARLKARGDSDTLFKEWYTIYNRLNVTLARIKKDGKERPETIKKYLKQLKGIVDNGYNPDGIRKTRIDWFKSFEKEEIVYRHDK